MKLKLTLGLTALMVASQASAQTTTERVDTKYPIVLSHHWGGTARTSFLGDEYDLGQFNMYGIKEDLEQRGAVVWQPDKLPFASHQVRGQLLYKKCEVTTKLSFIPTKAEQEAQLNEALCKSGNKKVVSGIYKEMHDYCSLPAMRGTKYTSYSDCVQNIKVNIICHSQGCPDSRYMISALTNELSNKPMDQHVATWTSLAGANKGTRLADFTLALLGCTTGCNMSILGQVFNLLGFWNTNQDELQKVYSPEATESARALTRKYMTQTMDMSCTPSATRTCAPSFNERYPNSRNVRYQSYSLKIDRLDPCTKEYEDRWKLLAWLDSENKENDGLITVDSQRFTTTGYSDSPVSRETGVIDRGFVMAHVTNRGTTPYPGMAHMAPSTHPAAGLRGPSCANDPSLQDYTFSREGFYRKIVSELRTNGY